MSGLGGDFGVRFARETWALYAVGLLGAVLRLYVFLAHDAWALGLTRGVLQYCSYPTFRYS